ncbi:DNA-binding protein [Burkholderia sp. S171]|uniref:DNA-binding protein n=1 Tax=Burkholderia sp. S171 TaxID=1641860 RepID=UPI00131B0BA9|nr:DNA-binding protein [Burkholderia sp. S171]
MKKVVTRKISVSPAERAEVAKTPEGKARHSRFIKLLMSMPNVGLDSDFERIQGVRKSPGETAEQRKTRRAERPRRVFT